MNTLSWISLNYRFGLSIYYQILCNEMHVWQKRAEMTNFCKWIGALLKLPIVYVAATADIRNDIKDAFPFSGVCFLVC